MSDEPAVQRASPPQFTADELRRVGIAATLAVVSSIVIVLVMLPIVGYSGLAHAGPRAFVHGAAIALLIGDRGRWRCLALLGIVLGLFFGFIQPGIAPLAIVFSIAGILGALVGRVTNFTSRAAAILLACILFELLSSAGTALRIVFSTQGGREPVLWVMYALEMPLRVAGTITGVWLARRTTRRARRDRPVMIARVARPTRARSNKPPRATTVIVLLTAMLGCSVPMTIDSLRMLAIVAGAYIVVALILGVRRSLLHIVLALIWCWLIYGAASYAWHRDLDRALDLGRTFVLRFTPMAVSALMIIKLLRGSDVLRMLRYLRLSAVILLPLASVLRELRAMTLEFRRTRLRIRRVRAVCGRTWWIRRPRLLFAALPARSFHGWIEQLAE